MDASSSFEATSITDIPVSVPTKSSSPKGGDPERANVPRDVEAARLSQSVSIEGRYPRSVSDEECPVRSDYGSGDRFGKLGRPYHAEDL
jgi:hypothetical protein